MTIDCFNSRIIIALGSLTLSITAFCIDNTITDSPVNAPLIMPKKTSNISASFSSTADCIPDTVISAATLSETKANGPFVVTAKPVSRQVASGFGGGTIFYPNHTEGCGLLGAIAVVPGYVSYENSIKWLGPRLASWGFVVITMNTNSIYDHPDSRATQLSAALDHIITDSTVGSMIDRKRLGVIGWSMGGGGALRLASERNTIRAIMPLAPYHDEGYSEVKTPTLIIACQNDLIASNKKYTNIFYDKLAGPKMKIEVNNGSHFCPSYRLNEKLLSKPAIAWMQRYINEDSRFDKFLCSNENYAKSPRFSAYHYANCS